MTSVPERLMAGIEYDTNGGCWLWSRRTSNRGLPVITTDGFPETAYRVSYREFVGPLSSDLCVLHRCDTPACINPAHLFLGTQADNMADMRAKGRAQRRLTDEQLRKMKELKEAGLSERAIARALNIANCSVRYRLKQMERAATTEGASHV